MKSFKGYKIQGIKTHEKVKVPLKRDFNGYVYLRFYKVQIIVFIPAYIHSILYQT